MVKITVRRLEKVAASCSCPTCCGGDQNGGPIFVLVGG